MQTIYYCLGKLWFYKSETEVVTEDNKSKRSVIKFECPLTEWFIILAGEEEDVIQFFKWFE